MLQVQDNLNDAQRNRLARFETNQCVDVHCHCLCGLDDGPATMEDSVALCRALADDGITNVIAAPHQLGRYDGRNEAAEIRKAVAALNTALGGAQVPLTVSPGADVRLDERIASLLEADHVMTLGDGGKYLLVELPHDTFIDPRPLLIRLASRGITTILSHPERHAVLAANPQAALPWVDQGAVLQITAGSLLGDFRSGAEQAAWHWLASGAAALVGTDAHNTAGRAPRMSAAIDVIAQRLGHLAARRVCIENPASVLHGNELSVSPRRRGMRRH